MTDTSGLDHWSGAAGEHWAAEVERYDRMNQAFADRIMAAAEPTAGERFLDIGCGRGALALSLADRVAPGGGVVGLDLSRQMLDVARRRASDHGVDNVDFVHADVQVHDLAGVVYDGAVSRPDGFGSRIETGARRSRPPGAVR
jgi:cyclopropane fatty-acyl-phospholipid synthase-like methyltransferase